MGRCRHPAMRRLACGLAIMALAAGLATPAGAQLGEPRVPVAPAPSTAGVASAGDVEGEIRGEPVATADRRDASPVQLVGQAAAEPETRTSAPGAESAAERAGRGDFDASGQIPCAQVRGQPMGPCDFAVARGPGGEATVVVTRFDGTTRALFFEGGAFFSADTSQADGYPASGATKEADLFIIRVGDERYEIPEAVVFGG